MKIRYFISDHHLFHENILKYCNRPFKDVKEMGEALLTYHNEVVRPEDSVSFMGDVTIRRGGRIDKEWFCREINKYNGHKRLYLGNHDHFPIQTYIDAGFEKIYATWRDEKGILFSHIPVHPNSLGSAKANCHGHIHQNPNYPPHVFKDQDGRTRYKPYINLSCEAVDYRPVSYDQLLAKIDAAKGEYEGHKLGY